MTIRNRIFLNVPYKERSKVKKAGARWDESREGWYVYSDTADLEALKAWLPRRYLPGLKSSPLCIKMVPDSMHYINLRSLLSPKQWDILRKKQYEKAGYRCEICGMRGDKHPVECNEDWYYQGLHTEGAPKIQRLKALEVLCPDCHSCVHLGHTTGDGKADKAFRHLMYINRWDEEECEKQVKRAEATYKKRAEYNWALDLSLLTKHGIKTIQPSKPLEIPVYGITVKPSK